MFRESNVEKTHSLFNRNLIKLQTILKYNRNFYSIYTRFQLKKTNKIHTMAQTQQ